MLPSTSASWARLTLWRLGGVALLPPCAVPTPRRGNPCCPPACLGASNQHTRTLVALCLALSATSALAQDYNRQDIVRGLCQKDGCDEFTILAADRIRTTDEGTLFKTRVQTFHASHAGRQERGQEHGYVYCSPTPPAIMAEQSGQTMAFFLAPFATQESRESVRQN